MSIHYSSTPPVLQRMIMFLLCGMITYLMALSMRHLRSLWTVQRRSLRLILSLQKPLEQRDFDQALRLCQRAEDSPMARLLSAALQTYAALRGRRGLAGDLQRTVESQKMRLLSPLRSELSGLAMIAVLAPGVGMFATVVGMVNVLTTVPLVSAGTVAAGFGQALNMTAAGLIVAVTALAAYGYLRGAVDALGRELDEVSGELITVLLRPTPALYSYRSAPRC